MTGGQIFFIIMLAIQLHIAGGVVFLLFNLGPKTKRPKNGKYH